MPGTKEGTLNVRECMKELIGHALEVHSHTKSIADQLGLQMREKDSGSEEKEAEAGPIGTILSQIGSVSRVLSRIESLHGSIRREIERL